MRGLALAPVVALLAATPARAEVTLSCDRPAEPAFEAARDREAVRRNTKLLRDYSSAARAYTRCLNREVTAERDRVLAAAKRFREQLNRD